jgi:hypothetical protein
VNKGQKRKKTPTLTDIPFKKQSMFFKYHPCMKDLETWHNIDLMHVTKNVFDTIIRTLLDMSRKTKDGLKLCNDLVQFGLRSKLHSNIRPNGKHYLPPASYSLIVEEKKAFYQCLHGVRVSTSFSSNIGKFVYVRLQFSRLSCCDYDFSCNRNKGHQTDAYQSTHHTLVLHFQYNFTEGDWS